MNYPDDLSSSYTAPIGGYVLESMLGAGSAGIVYRARRVDHTPLAGDERPKTVALKILRADASTNPQVLACFQFEGRVLTRVRHPGILRVYETGLDNGLLYSAMELIDGPSLDKVLATRKRLPLREAVHVVQRAAEALAFLHENGFAHRDVKPANLLYQADGRVVLFDFGMAMRIQAGVDYETGIYGTPAYAAPEQIDSGGAIDGRSDLYSLGIVLYQLTTGRKPFYGTRGEVLHHHLSTDPPHPSQFTRMPAELEQVILRALAKDPAKRFATGTELSQALISLEADLPLEEPSLGQRLFAWMRRGSNG